MNLLKQSSNQEKHNFLSLEKPSKSSYFLFGIIFCNHMLFKELVGCILERDLGILFSKNFKLKKSSDHSEKKMEIKF